MGFEVSTYGSVAGTELVRQTESAPPRQYFLKVAAVFVLYLAAGKLGLSVPFTSGNVSPVWPASGVALASVLL